MECLKLPKCGRKQQKKDLLGPLVLLSEPEFCYGQHVEKNKMKVQALGESVGWWWGTC